MPLPGKSFKTRGSTRGDINIDMSARGNEGCYCSKSLTHVQDYDVKSIGKEESKPSRNPREE